MIEHRVGVHKHPVWVLPNALTADECATLATRGPRGHDWPPGEPNAYIAKQQARADELGALLLPRLHEVPITITGWTKYVTYTRTRRPTAWHFDHEDGDADFKVYAYLNDAPGTYFDRKACLFVPGIQGTVVVFSLDLEHAGAPHPQSELKLLIGLRPVTV